MGVSFITLRVKNLEASKDFYEKAAGLSLQREFSPFPGFTIAFMGDGEGAMIELIEDQSPQSPGVDPSASVSIGFHTGDSAAKLGELTNAGLQAQRIELPNGVSMTNLNDPDGYAVSFVQQ